MTDSYALAAARIAAAALINAAGFDVCQQSCVDVLADLLLKYVREVGAGSHHFAELAGRTETNPVDVALALNDMGTSVAQLREFVRQSQEVPFEHSIASFPLRKQSRPAPSFLERGEAPPPHIPPWLPALPDRHAHLASPVYPVHEKDPQRRQVLLTEQRQQAQQAAVRLQARLTASGNRLLAEELVGEGTADGEGGSTDAGGQMQHSQGVAAATGASNPFLAPAADPQQAAPGAHELAGDWEDVALQAGPSAGAGFAGQQLPAGGQDWRSAQQRAARVATGGRAVPEAFGGAHDEAAAARAGKRQKRSGAAVAAVALASASADPTRTRVEALLAHSAQATATPEPAAAANDVVREQI